MSTSTITSTIVKDTDGTAWANAAWTASGGSGNGTVTTLSVVTANGVSGTVATATTTPAITLALGAITPTAVTTSRNIGPATAPTGAGTAGDWCFSQDGKLSFCKAGTWEVVTTAS